MISGVLYALLAGLMWGLIFVGPLIVPEYPAMLQSMGRYGARVNCAAHCGWDACVCVSWRVATGLPP